MSDFFMNKSSDDWNKLKHLVDLSAENARLKAEVERLAAEVSFDKRVQLHVDKLVAEFTQCQVERLQAEVERLRKAGDAMADAAYAHCMCQDCEELRDQWRDAKRGNQP